MKTTEANRALRPPAFWNDYKTVSSLAPSLGAHERGLYGTPNFCVIKSHVCSFSNEEGETAAQGASGEGGEKEDFSFRGHGR